MWIQCTRREAKGKVLVLSPHGAFVQTFQAFAERGFWFLQAFGGQFARTRFDEDRAIGEDDGGDTAYAPVETQHLGSSALISLNIDILIGNAVRLEPALRHAAI